MMWILLNFALPALIGMGWWLLDNLMAFSVSSAAFWESIAVAVYLYAFYALPAGLAIRERRLRRAGLLR